MRTAPRSIPAVVALLVSSVLGAPAFSQAPQFVRAEASSVQLGLSLSPHPCSFHSESPAAALARGIPAPGNSLSSCVSAMPAADRPAPVAPCNLTTQAVHPCSPSSDIVRDDLNTMGKHGQIILRARDKVLEILQSDTACAAWYRTKDPDPAATFGTLTFFLDPDGDVYVKQGPESGGTSLIRNPYVARVLQGAGRRSTVTINVNGAFFFSIANVIDDRFEGGPVSFHGSRSLQVGPYRGGSFHAQVLALLHEFGHVINLLPQDHDDYQGRSRKNTQDVLDVCRAEVESKEAPRTFFASR